MEVGRVQSIANKTASKDTIPLDFIWPENVQPAITTVHGADIEIPLIELDDDDEERLIKLIAKASSEVGLFQIVNHGIPSDVIERFQKVGKEFFELSQEEKERYGKLPGSVEGYGSSLQKEDDGKKGMKKGWVDHIFHRVWPPSAINLRFWPTILTSYREVNEEYAKYLRRVGDKLFTYLSLGLGLERHELREGAGGDDIEYLLKINYYPPCPRPDLALGVPAHSDMSAITLLVPNDVPGLQICKDDRWYNVNYVPNAIVIHIGDQIEIMSNGKYKAVMHRTTVSKDKTRFSWPVFLEPPLEQIVGPISKLINKQNPARFTSQKYRDYSSYKYNNISQQKI
ncbi:hypothetical protein BVRB_8g202170 [Beta vulgaris subsp. vulgaris]|uniref:Fe2OG dioxygenase domain-containing protein n=1 Tax=Beta vulgaris subsp. vulgaris TaxID=3555 RepID=A0A0J8B5N3_BETVV|nr:hypothetical protein BVRB_8g202170 [Beta vulgaris subsp. vulgaris]